MQLCRLCTISTLGGPNPPATDLDRFTSTTGGQTYQRLRYKVFQPANPDEPFFRNLLMVSDLTVVGRRRILPPCREKELPLKSFDEH